MTALTALLLSVVFISSSITLIQCSSSRNDENHTIKLHDAVDLKIPKNSTEKIISLEINMNKNEETGRGNNKKLMQRILPMFILPFVMQSAIVPLFLGLLKFMLFKSLMIGKLALVLIIINAFKNSNSFKGRQDEAIANIHYGFHGNGNEEYGSYFNR
ncbi:uncharacterized protein LOC116768551 [Danaus plexippus]|uniref:uncharacterized protein LOC116768551 n=1 Tax=Danaus plexippus TaxID=13037 RepID=UPI002AAFA94C|nr:uncharacterized protein LOC116768551 [Danaus plexippus]